MFKKPFANLKTFSPLRSSDRRRFQNEAYEAYPSLKQICSEEGAPHLMPDDLRSAKFTAHSGVTGTVYMSKKQTTWISLENLPPIPTVYTMWQYPDMLPKLYTWGPVVQKLIDGADLMIPGLVLGPEGVLPTLKTGDLVAITIKGYSYPLAIGTMTVPTSEIKPRSGMKGKAVNIIHVYEDYLWSMEIDEWLKKSLYQALVYKIKESNASTILPLSASSLYSAYIMPCRPMDVGTEIDIKKSSYKKLQKFLKAMDKSGLLKTKEQRGETMLISVNWSHPSLQGLHKYKTMESTTQPTKDTAKQTIKPTLQQQKSKQEQAEIQEIFKPLGTSMIKFFEEAKHDTDALYTIPEVRAVVADYIKLHDLVNPQNQKMIKIDPVMCDTILTKPEYNSINELARDQILHRICLKMQPFHSIKLPGKEPVLRKGQPKPVEITQEIRQGRKTITKVTGVEGFGLDVEELSKELTRLCASSTTYNTIQGVSPKNPLYEIMVQGPQIKTITELMLSKGVPKRFIDTIDKTAKKKK
ncbi:hypothetical protein INT48_001268 [Thamnidium elegans]|uniref:Ligatin n=1 Tax=Thamnidium elegans TaxID=101142 RepID=A0A8H7SK62_9FUNG|nr:hypothetical protein INT48_001268 [Thamnidium elegans]